MIESPPQRPGTLLRARVRGSVGRLSFIVAMMGCIMVALATRWLFLDAESIWFDEGWTWWLVTQPAGRMFRLMQADNVAPGFFYLLHAWTRLFGDSAFAMRSLPALLATLVLLPWGFIASRLFASRRAWLVASLLIAVSFMQTQFARDARPYALMTLLTLAALACVPTLAARRSWPAMAGFAVGVIGGMYTHNLMGFYAVSLAAAWLVWPGERPLRGRMIDLSIVVVVAIVAYAPWVPTLREQARWMVNNFWVERPDLTQGCLAMSSVSGVDVYNVTPTLWGVFGWSPRAESIAAFITIAAAVAGVLAIWTTDAAARRRAIALCGVAFGPIVAVYLYSLVAQPIFIGRLFMASSALVPLIIALPLDGGRRRSVRIFGGAIAGVIGVLGTVSTMAFLVMPQKEDWRGAYAYVAHLPASARRLIVFVSAEGQLPFDYYATHDPARIPEPKTGTPRGFFDNDPPRTIQRVRSDADLASLRATLATDSFDEVVLVLSHQDFVDPGRLTLRWCEANLALVEERSLRNVRVMRFERPQSGRP